MGRQSQVGAKPGEQHPGGGAPGGDSRGGGSVPLATQNRLLGLVAAGRPLPEILEALALAVEQACDGAIASVTIVDAEQRLRVGAAPHLPEACRRALDGVRIGPAAACCGTAAYRGERVVVRDVQTDPLCAGYAALAREAGLRACWSQPILSVRRKVLGTLALHYREPREPDGAECQSLEAAAHLAGIAIERDEIERARQATSRRLLSQSAVLLELAKSEALAQSDFAGFGRLAIEASAATLGVERVGIWLFDDQRSVLRCADLYQLSLDRHSEGVVLQADRYPRYFAALERGRVVAAHDARSDADTAEFTEGYLRPNSITSMMDAPVRKAGAVVGVVCHEHVGPPRIWASEEQEFAASVADLLSLALEAAERRRAEQAFRVAQEELLRQQWQARRQVESELERVKDELIRSTRLATVGQVAASIAHELRNPLAAVGNAEFYLRKRVPPDQPKWTEYLDIIGQELHAADAIIDNLLEMSRAKQPVRRRVDLGAAAREAFGRVKEARALQLAVDVVPDPFVIEADPDQLRQLLVNLITNSAQAMEGRGRIVVEGREEADSASITLVDDGPGIPPEVRPRIFEPLFTTKHKGTGLGLTISSQIAERHGWLLELAEAGERGAAFRLRIRRESARKDANRWPPAS